MLAAEAGQLLAGKEVEQLICLVRRKHWHPLAALPEQHLGFIHPPHVTQHSPTFCQPLGPEVPWHTMVRLLIVLTDQDLGPLKGLPSSGHHLASQCRCWAKKLPLS